MPRPTAKSFSVSTNISRARLRRAAERLRMQEERGADTAKQQSNAAAEFDLLEPYEKYWVFPGPEIFSRLRDEFNRSEFETFANHVRVVEHHLNAHGDRASLIGNLDELAEADVEALLADEPHYFTVLLVDDMPPEEVKALKQELRLAQADVKDFIYQLLYVDSLEDALIAALFNYDIQACIILYDIPFRAKESIDTLGTIIDQVAEELGEAEGAPLGLVLGEILKDLRPHLDLYLMTEESVTDSADATHSLFNRVFYGMDVPTELHMTILEGLRMRFETPFFDALKANAEAPIGNFHALPIARGNSIFNSKWIRDMADFYGPNIFMAETSSTTGGLDSLLAPTGAIKEAQDKAAQTWGSERTYFATNGTSTSNKVVVQALTRPGDIVLIDRNCHKSHHYGMVLNGAYPLYLDAYPLEEYSIFGAVPLKTIKKRLLELKRLGRLDKVKMLLLTNCTFDGIVYNPVRVMEEVLAIKPDICFLWDEAWYAFASFVPYTRWRTAMNSARVLAERYRSDAYREEYAAYKENMDALDQDDEGTWLENQLMPDPDVVRIRVYATQSTHKSMSALRQGSMIHVRDQDFSRKTAGAFDEAYLTHTSTSPNYQIIASLDLARRQADLEGYAMVSDAYYIADTVRQRVETDPLLSRYFKILTPEELIPGEFRGSGLTTYMDTSDKDVLSTLMKAWMADEFVLDPTRMTLYLANTGYNGNEFKVDVLMEQYGIQVNKTSINSVLLIVTIGVTWSSVAYLLDVLKRIAEGVEKQLDGSSSAELTVFDKKVKSLTVGLPELPAFSCFHSVFRPDSNSSEGDMRTAYFLEYDEENREYFDLEDAVEMLKGGRELVSTSFVVPYPPGFPILVPGQVVSLEIIDFMQKLDVSEIHGYRPELGLSVFTEDALLEAGRGTGRIK